MVNTVRPRTIRMICIHLTVTCYDVSKCRNNIVLETDGFAAGYTGIVLVGPADKVGLIMACSHFTSAVHVRVHFPTHHQPFVGAAPFVVALFCVVQGE